MRDLVVGCCVRRSPACFSSKLSATVAVAVLAISATACSQKENLSDEVEGASPAALNSNPQITNFGVYAQNSATLRDRTVLTGGDVGVHVAGTGPFLVTGYELALVVGVQVDTTHNTIANRVLLQGAKVGDVQTNTLTVQNGGTYAKKYAFPTTMPTLPTLAPVFAGTTALTVNASATVVASPGAYGAVTLGSKSILRLTGGVYHLASLQLDDDARIEALAPVQVRVSGRLTGRLSTLARIWIGPATGVTLTAADLRIEVSGKNGTGGGLTETPKAAAFGNDATILGVILVPNGTLQMGQRNILTGALVGRDVYVDMDSKLTFQSGLAVLKCAQFCNDGNPCTKDTCTGEVCSYPSAASGTSCSDGNPCNGAEICDGKGTCKAGTPITCTALDQCHGVGVCDPGTGVCSNPAKADGTSCNDGNACTVSDICRGGTCSGTTYSCDDGLACTTDACKGDGTCTHTLAANSCAIGGACYAAGAANPTNSCQQCTPATSTSNWTSKSNGTACNDGKACTKNDVCTGGGCAGTAYSCDDGIACTTDACNGDGTCSHPVVAGSCLISGACYAAGAVNPANQCQQCTPTTSQTAWSAKTNGTACNDGNACTKNDMCTAGTCGGTMYSCDDGLACTTDSCNGDGTCNHAIAAGNCAIAGACYASGATNATNQCQQCTPATSQTAWSAKTNGTACNDGNACTSSDKCTAGTCGGTLYSCDDGIACTTDTCKGDGTCTHTLTAGNCLIAGACYAGAAANPANICQVCNPAQATTWSNQVDGTACNDGNACTSNDKCTAGTCSGTLYSCDDGLACTTDACSGDGTCTHTVAAGNCAIGGACYAAGIASPANQCQQCAPATSPVAWSPKANGSTCDDGNACTKGDNCQAGVCSGTADPVVPPATNVSINVTASLDASTGLAVDGQQVFPVPTSFTLPAVIPVIDGLSGMGTAVLSFHSATECIDVSCSYLGASSVPQAVTPIDKLLGHMYKLQSCSDGSQANLVLSVTTIGLHVASGDIGTPQVVIQLLVSYPGGGNGPPSPDGGVPGSVGVPVPPAKTDDRGGTGSLVPPDYSKSKSNPLINGQFTPQADPGLTPLDPFGK